MSTAKISVSQLTLYNPARRKDPEIVAAFVARRALFERVLADIAAEKPNSRAQHHLIVGQRGMGKSTLLARLAAELRTNAELAKRFVPLVFAEEQYAVDRLSKFWLNCLDALADAAERAGDTAASERIDAVVRRLKPQPAGAGEKDEAPAHAALDAFLQTAESGGKRPVLLVDNLQLVFERITETEQHALRELLMRPGSPILVGTSPSPPPESQDYGAAFYDHFKTHYLRALSADEMGELMLKLAEITNRTDVRDRVRAHPERLQTLRELTGGNPRTVVALFFLYAEDFSPSVFADLENLLDRVTPLYKARIEELSDQQQVVVSAVADHWAPVTARTVADSTGLPMASISGQLDRLEKVGFVEKVEIFGQTSTGYQVAERFFNIWFLMRSASRRQRREVEFLVRFIESFYEAKDRPRLAQLLMNERNFSADRFLFVKALACTLDPDDKEDLTRHAELDALRQKAEDARLKLEEVIDFSKLPPATLAFDELRKKLIALVPAGAGVPPEQFAEEVLGDRELFMRDERERLAASAEQLTPEKVNVILQMVEITRKVDQARYGEDSAAWFRHRLATGQLLSPNHLADWNRAFLKAEAKNTVQLLVDTVSMFISSMLSEEARSCIRRFFAPKSASASGQWNDWGVGTIRLGWYAEAELAFRKSTELDPQNAVPWNNLGSLLQAYLGRTREAEVVYRKAIELDPRSASPWIGLGNLLVRHLGRYGEAEQAYRRAIELHPQDGGPWNGLGNLYCDYLQRYEEAARAYGKALEIADGHECVRHNLVFLQRDFLGDPQAARLTFGSLRAAHSSRYQDTFQLQEALFATYDANWGVGSEALANALRTLGHGFPADTEDDWFRASAVLLHLNYGSQLLAFLRERGEDARLRPWYEALSALQQGDRRYLQNVPVEVRTTGEFYFDQIEKRLIVLPEKTRRRPLPKLTKERRKT
jgi:Flp pilus assembly protein TadD